MVRLLLEAMSGSSRKRGSKWDLREEHQFEPSNVAADCWPGKTSMSFHDEDSECRWLSPEVVGSNNSKWSDREANDLLNSKHDLGLASGEPLPRSSVSLKDSSFSKGRNRNLEASLAWDGDGSYSMRMSPGLEEWRGPSRSLSPKNGWSRSLRFDSPLIMSILALSNFRKFLFQSLSLLLLLFLFVGLLFHFGMFQNMVFFNKSMDTISITFPT